MVERLRVGPIGTNCYILPVGGGGAGSECLVVDPGDEADRIADLVLSREWKPLALVLTHGHLDHVAALGALRARFSARGLEAPILVHRLDAAYLGAAAEGTHRRLFTDIRALSFFESLWTALPEPDLLLEEGDVLPGSNWQVIHCPGHSAGSVCFFDSEKGILISGDTLFRDGVGRTDGFDSDPAALRESIVLKLFALPPDTKVYPGHGEPTTIGREGGGRG